MKILFDFFPIIFFFTAYKFYGIYIATAVAMVASVLQVSIFWLKHRKFELTHILTLVFIFVLGGATILSHNAIFIKWKPTVIYWTMAILFIGSHFFKKTLLERMMDKKITLPHTAWKTLNISWITFFLIIGGINLLVAYNFSTDTWVNFKLFGVVGCTIVFGILQSLWISRLIDKIKPNP